MIVKNDLFDYKNRYIYQDTNLFKFSLDSILLSEFVKLKKDDNLIIDMCAGNMAIPLIISTKTSKNFVGFEIQKEVYDLACKSISENNLDNQIFCINDDIKSIGNYYNPDSVDVFICNPPFFKVGDNYLNNNKMLSVARHEIMLTLEDIFKIARIYLKNNGSLYIVHRVSRLDEIIVCANNNNVRVKDIQLITTKVNDKPYLVLIKCVKNGKFGLNVFSQVCVENLKTYKGLFEED